MNQVTRLLIWICLTSLTSAREYQKACTLDVDRDLTKIKQPLMVTKIHHQYELVRPEKIDKDSLISMSKNDRFLLFCPGEKNKLNILQEEWTTAACNRNQLHAEKWPNKIKNTNQFQCTQQLEPQLKKIDQKCGEDMTATIFQAGYQIDAISTWFPLLTICHDISKMDTLYSMYTLIGKSIDARQKRVPRPHEFFVGNLQQELFNGKSPNSFYTKFNAMITIQQLFQLADVSEYADLENKFLSRGHLSPDADMLLSSWKIATYFFINVAPQWQDINAGNWLKVENKIRKAAAVLQDDLTIITGTRGVMKLKIHQQEKDIYLAPGEKLKVPEYFWKVIYHAESQSSIVIITSNNPYLTEIKPFCNDICHDFNWWSKEFHNIAKGYTYCCTYEDFKNIVTYVPELQVQGTLKMPDKPPIWKFRSGVKKIVKNIRGSRLLQKNNDEQSL